MSEIETGFFFKPSGKKAFARKPVSVLLPPETDEYVRSLSNRTEWLREAIAEKVEREKLDLLR